MTAQPTIQTWEEVEAIRRPIGHDAAVQESLFLQKLFRRQWSDRMAASPVDLNDIVRTLSGKKIPFVLIGAHAYGGWTGRPRSTFDVDILVKSGRNLPVPSTPSRISIRNWKSVRFRLRSLFIIPGETTSVIDVFDPHRADLEEALTTAIWIDNKERGLRYRIPSLENALASKCGAMLNSEPRSQQEIARRSRLRIHGQTLAGRRPAADRPGSPQIARRKSLARWRRRRNHSPGG